MKQARTRHGVASLQMYCSEVQQATNTYDALLAIDNLPDLARVCIRLHIA